MAQILIVDDSATVRNEVSSYLRGQGFDVAEAVDGRDGLEKLKDTRIRLVISDVNMPVMDGLTMIEKLRNEGVNNNVHVIMLTTESDPRMKERGKAAGVKGWIVKPFNGAAVIGGVKKLVNS